MTDKFKHKVIKWLNSEYDGIIETGNNEREIYYRCKGSILFLYDIPSNTMLFRHEQSVNHLLTYLSLNITEIKDILITWTSQKFNIKRNVDFRFSPFMKIKM